MSDVIERPSFYEGQILSAADLQAAVDHAAGQMARHERYLHLWGIASGLTLDKQDRSTAGPPPQPYVEVTIKSGVAIDGTGREVVVPADTPLSEAAFDEGNVAVGAGTDDWFPVFLIGGDESGVVPSFGSLACTTGVAARMIENFSIQFGRPGQAAQLDNQTIKAPSDGPGSSEWRVLVGFVQWDASIGKFKAIADKDQGIGPRYAGVCADEVAARSGTLVLRSAPRTAAGKSAVVMDDTNGGEFRFGLQNAAGVVTPVFTVNAKGDVKAEGKIQGAVTPGSVQVQSGTAMDSVVLPLPPGVTEDMVALGKATVHVQLMPRMDITSVAPAGPHIWVSVPSECRVDADRRLHCTIRWLDLSTPSPPIVTQDLPGLCDYLLVVAVAASAGGQ
ncbi:MAG TPA: hypothetical protein VGO01_09995 [Bradyrhizobium sp.]|nr:hypothetical protein [Bradyrhizobium sp.]